MSKELTVTAPGHAYGRIDPNYRKIINFKNVPIKSKIAIDLKDG